jgi:hypothetical protein
LIFSLYFEENVPLTRTGEYRHKIGTALTSKIDARLAKGEVVSLLTWNFVTKHKKLHL